jgi:hypothetical protein
MNPSVAPASFFGCTMAPPVDQKQKKTPRGFPPGVLSDPDQTIWIYQLR